MGAAAIACEGLTKRFGKFTAISGIDLEVQTGEAFGFVGPNGAGKTTTIRALLGFIRPSAGRSAIFGHDSWRQSVLAHEHLGNLSGDFAFADNLTGREVIEHVARLRGASDALPHADELAERLRADLSKPLGSLSRGNLKKIGLVQAMFHRPDLLVLDEPTSGLDPLIQEEFIALVQEARDAGATIFLSSHYLLEVERICRRVGIIRAGRLVATENVHDLTERALRHVEVTFVDGAPPESDLTSLPGARDVSLIGGRASLRMAGNLDPLVALLARHRVADLTIERASLEELFLSYYGEEPTREDHASSAPATEEQAGA